MFLWQIQVHLVQFKLTVPLKEIFLWQVCLFYIIAIPFLVVVSVFPTQPVLERVPPNLKDLLVQIVAHISGCFSHTYSACVLWPLTYIGVCQVSHIITVHFSVHFKTFSWLRGRTVIIHSFPKWSTYYSIQALPWLTVQALPSSSAATTKRMVL